MDAWTAKDRRVAIWSVLGTFFFGVLYAPTLVAAFVSAGNVKDPLTDPFLEILEVQSILMAPPMVVTMVAVHGYAPRDAKMYSLSALGFMILCAGVTTSVHFVELTVARRIDPASMPGYSQLFSWEWPSVLYTLDILAWDWFFGLSMLLAAPVSRAAYRSQLEPEPPQALPSVPGSRRHPRGASPRAPRSCPTDRRPFPCISSGSRAVGPPARLARSSKRRRSRCPS